MDEAKLKTLLANNVLSQFPESVALDVLKDDSFQKKSGLGLKTTITFGGQKLSIARELLFDCFRKLYAGETEITTQAADGVEVTLNLRLQDGVPIVEATKAGETFLVPPFYALSSDADLRLQMFDAQTQEGYLPPSKREKWRSRLAEGALNDEEVSKFDHDMAISAQRAASDIASELQTANGNAHVSSLVRPSLEFCDALIGSAEEKTLEDFLAKVAPQHAKDLIAWDSEQGLMQVVLACSHTALTRCVPTDQLTEATLADVYAWLDEKGDRFSQVAAFEIGRAHV